MKFEERPLAFQCKNDWLYGILSLPEQAVARGVLIVVGGPQYRVGSHRQFTLLARHLAEHGIPVMRFDYRGMGDSEGDRRTFENLEDDLFCAVNTFFKEFPGLSNLVIWGLCDAASAALFYAHRDRRVSGLILVNPWVRTDEGVARVYLKHYYTSRLFKLEFWSKVWRGDFNYAAAIRSLSKIAAKVLIGTRKEAATVENTTAWGNSCNSAPLPERMYYGLSRFKQKVLLIISGNDLTAQEFSDLIQESLEWQKLLASLQVSRLDLPGANHTFSRRDWRDQVAVWTREWIQSW